MDKENTNMYMPVHPGSVYAVSRISSGGNTIDDSLESEPDQVGLIQRVGLHHAAAGVRRGGQAGWSLEKAGGYDSTTGFNLAQWGLRRMVGRGVHKV